MYYSKKQHQEKKAQNKEDLERIKNKSFQNLDVINYTSTIRNLFLCFIFLLSITIYQIINKQNYIINIILLSVLLILMIICKYLSNKYIPTFSKDADEKEFNSNYCKYMDAANVAYINNKNKEDELNEEYYENEADLDNDNLNDEDLETENDFV